MNKTFLLALSLVTVFSSQSVHFVLGSPSAAQEAFERKYHSATTLETCIEALKASTLNDGSEAELGDHIRELLRKNPTLPLHDFSERTLRQLHDDQSITDQQYQNLQHAFEWRLRIAESQSKEEESSCNCDCLGALFSWFDSPSLIGT